MSDAGWLKPHLLHIRDCRSVILGSNGVREQELRLALGSVDFDREGDGGADEDTVDKRKPIDAANDAGSGIAVMLEIARDLQAKSPDIGVVKGMR